MDSLEYNDRLNEKPAGEIQQPQAEPSESDEKEITSEIGTNKNKAETNKWKSLKSKIGRKKRKETAKHDQMTIDDVRNSLENISTCNIEGEREKEKPRKQQQQQQQQHKGDGKNTRTTKRIKNKSQRMKIKVTEKQKLREDNQRLQEENEHMEIVIDSEREITKSLKAAIQFPKEERLREENNRKDAEIQRLQVEIINKDTEIQRLHRENSSKCSQIQRLQRENSSRDAEIQRLERENNYNITTIKRLQDEKDNTMSGSVKVLHEELGRGAYGTVLTGEFYGTKVAVKEYHEIIVSAYYLEILEREINIASQCRHPNLLQFLCAAQNDRQRLLIVTELMDMSLRTLLLQRATARLQLVDQEVKSISLDVARGLNYLHSKTPNPIIHRDVSSANVLLWFQNNTVGRAKISDYGSANFMQLCNTENPGAILYAAPEAKRAQHDPKIDVYSYGILVCEMCICELPKVDDREAQRDKISNVDIKQLVESCTKEDPQERRKMQDIIGFWEEFK